MLANAVKETTTTAGTGTVTLSAVAGYARFSAFPVGAPVGYGIKTAAGDWEWGIGVVGAGDTLERAIIQATFASGVYVDTGASPLDLSGTSEVICVQHATAFPPAITGLNSLVGQRVVHPDGLRLSANSHTLTVNQPRGSCLLWNCTAPITHLTVEVSTAAGSGSDRMQIGVYACTPAGEIGRLMLRSGDMSPSTTGIKSAAVVGGARRLPPGWYWWMVCSSSSCAVRGYAAGNFADASIATPMGFWSTVNNRNVMARCSNLSGGWTALPDTLTAVSLDQVSSTFAPTLGAVI